MNWKENHETRKSKLKKKKRIIKDEANNEDKKTRGMGIGKEEFEEYARENGRKICRKSEQ